jgi:serine/threonine-protein kinase
VAACPYCGYSPIEPEIEVCPSCRAPLGSFALPAGAVLQEGKYRVDKVLGQGGFGITYQGWHDALACRIAIKELFPEGSFRRGRTLQTSRLLGTAGFAEQKRAFVDEARTLARFSHPGIVRVLDVCEENGTAYLVMEYLEGETLARRIVREGKLAPAVVLRLATEIGDALRTVHGANLLHRDIKPDNIFLTTDKRVVLIDFGAARSFVPGKTQHHTRLVTPGYGAPEQYTSEARFGPYTDLYALGCTLHHALTGIVPPPATDRMMGAKVPPLPRDVTDAVRSGLEKAMSIVVEDRPQDVAAFLLLIVPGYVARDPARSEEPSRPQTLVHAEAPAEPGPIPETAGPAVPAPSTPDQPARRLLKPDLPPGGPFKPDVPPMPPAPPEAPRPEVAMRIHQQVAAARDFPAPPPARPQPSRPWIRWAIGAAVLVVAGGGAAALTLFRSAPETAKAPEIAVTAKPSSPTPTPTPSTPPSDNTSGSATPAPTYTPPPDQTQTAPTQPKPGTYEPPVAPTQPTRPTGSGETGSTKPPTTPTAPKLPPLQITDKGYQAVTQNSAVIVWTTNRPANSFVTIFDGLHSLDFGQDDLALNHRVTASGLQSGTLYTATFRSKLGTENVSGQVSFATAFPELYITDWFVESVPGGVIVTWTTSRPASSFVSGIEYSSGLGQVGVDERGLAHRVQMNGFALGQVYLIQIRTGDTRDTVTLPLTVRTADPGTNLNLIAFRVDTSDYSATITWVTDNPSNSWAYLLPTTATSPRFGGDEQTRLHRVTVTGLTTGTAYQVQISSENLQGRFRQNLSFTTD